MNGRDKRRKIKQRQTKNEAGLTVLSKKAEPDNGKFCRVRMAKIDLAVCTVQSVRTPALCDGCGGAA